MPLLGRPHVVALLLSGSGRCGLDVPVARANEAPGLARPAGAEDLRHIWFRLTRTIRFI